MHYWSVDNPLWLRPVERQRPWTVNVWCGILGQKLIDPYIIQGNLSVVARKVLNYNFKDQWFGRAEPVSWPARSPDLMSPDLFLTCYANLQ
ncbi:hypothetical protein YQE_10318, partial [Dendroctonus ponderosae]